MKFKTYYIMSIVLLSLAALFFIVSVADRQIGIPFGLLLEGYVVFDLYRNKKEEKISKLTKVLFWLGVVAVGFIILSFLSIVLLAFV